MALRTVIPSEHGQTPLLDIGQGLGGSLGELVEAGVVRYQRGLIGLDGQAPKQRKIEFRLREFARSGSGRLPAGENIAGAVHELIGTPVLRLERRLDQAL